MQRISMLFKSDDLLEIFVPITEGRSIPYKAMGRIFESTGNGKE